MAKEKLLGVQWIARSYLTDTEFMDKDVEGTYFRLINYIYLTQDRLEDDDTKLWKRCKCTSLKQYRMHKAELLKPRGTDPETGEEIPARLAIRYQSGPISEGTSTPTSTAYLTSPKCQQQLGKSSKFRQAKSKAGKASVAARKPRKDNNSDTQSVATDASTEQSTHYKQSGQQNSQQGINAVGHNLKGYPSDNHPLTPSPSQPSAGSGCADAPPARPATAIPDSERVTVTLPTGAKLEIDGYGNVDEVWAPRDCPDTKLTPAQYRELRAEALKAVAKPPDTPEPIRARVDTDFGGPPSAVSC